MAKVLGAILTILGTIGSLGNIFLYLNSSAHLKYNPADKVLGLLDVGLVTPMIFFALLFLAGVLMLVNSVEPESK